MRFLSLFSGIGAFDLGLEQAGWTCAGQCEIDPYCRAVLAKHWPNVWRWEDVTTLTADLVRRECGAIDALAGGPPCQPFSKAGKGKAAADERNLWPDWLRLVESLRPRWLIAENVPDIRASYADEVLGGLEAAGYTCWPLVVGADDVGASHERKRAWFVAHANGEQPQRGGEPGVLAGTPGEAPGYEAERQRHGDAPIHCRADGSTVPWASVPDAHGTGRKERQPAAEPGRAGQSGGLPAAGDGWLWPALPDQPRHEWEQPWLSPLAVGGPAHGIALELDSIADGDARKVVRWANAQALKALGNAVVWHIPYLIALAINEVEAQR